MELLAGDLNSSKRQVAGAISSDLNELLGLQEIHVWSRDQETLENEARKELEIFSNERKDYNHVDSKANPGTDQIHNTSTNTRQLVIANNVTDINSLIKKQEEFQKLMQTANTKSKYQCRAISPNRDGVFIWQKHRKEQKTTREVQSSSKLEDININSKEEKEKARLVLFRSSKTKVNYEEMNNLNIEDGEQCFESGGGIGEQEETAESLNNYDTESEYVPSGEEALDDVSGTDDLDDPEYTNVKITPSHSKSRRAEIQISHLKSSKVIDDSIQKNYKSRLDVYYKNLEAENILRAINEDEDLDLEKYHMLKGGLRVLQDLWDKLYSFQQEGIEWLWELHQKPTGGLLGDEMGLGKTVQIIVFFHAIQYSNIISSHCRFNGLGPSIIVCPTTVIHQWVKHFHEWAPEFRIAVLHQSGTFSGNPADLIKEIHKARGIVVTTYNSIIKYKGNLLEHNWHYLILDEGHKIRNPTAKATIAIKQIRTPHRIMLTGSPMQNNLTELWSLFDFTNPGMLGNLVTFQEHFANPILHGGFSNASPMQEATALSVASTLKNVISPYLLRRSKKEVQHHILLPNKSEQVLFCSLTNEQTFLYKSYLLSEHVNMILGRGAKTWHSKNYVKANVLMAITELRKICNHPDLYLNEDQSSFENNIEQAESEKFGYYKRSGKMVVVSALLKIWKKQGHRVLLFSQGRSMIQVFQDFLEQQGYKYLKMDGSTSVTSRQGLIDTFNKDDSYDVFLLTTRVGGLGVNLTGANRVIIYDPDWNPATDTQAKERSWRIGQEKQVTVYRLVCAGTIEEKMYQRQVWKQLLSNKVLVDPATQRFFKTSDLYDLFSLEENVSNPETANIFRDSRVKIEEKYREKERLKKRKKPSKSSESETLPDVQFTDDKIQAMKSLAHRIAQSLSQKNHKAEEKEVKTFYQVELEEERKQKLQEKEKLKNLTAPELATLNRTKALEKEDDQFSKVDDCKVATFDKALEFAEKKANLYHKLNCGKIQVLKRKSDSIIPQENIKRQKNDCEEVSDRCNTTDSHAGTQSKCESSVDSSDRLAVTFHDKSKSHKSRKHKYKRRKKDKRTIDTSGKVDGEVVEGLVKCEIKNTKRKTTSGFECESIQNNFVLKHLFSKSGVSGALEHETVVGTDGKQRSLKVRTEADIRASKSLEALKKSRLNNWKW